MQGFSGEENSSPIDTLINAAGQGNRAAFGKLVELHQSGIRRFLRSLSRQEFDLADDLAQDTFVIAFQQIGQYRGEGTFNSWLMGIAYRRFIQYARKKKRRRELLEGSEEMLLRQIPSSPVTRIDLEKALNHLSLPEKTALVLHSREGYTHAEIAEVMEMPLGTVKSHLARGRDKIRTTLSGELKE